MVGLREPSAEYARRKEAPAFFGEPEKRGKVVFDQQTGNTSQQSPSLYYDHPNGELWIGDAIAWLSSISTGSVDLIFADPPYNIKKAEWDTFDSQQRYVEWSLEWIEHAARVLKPAGTMYICGFSEILADLKVPASRFFKGCRWLVWHYKNKANLGNDWGRSHESLLHFRKSKKFTLNVDDIRIPYGAHTQKYPSHPQAKTSNFGNGKKRDNWTPHPLGAKPKDVIEIRLRATGCTRRPRIRHRSPRNWFGRWSSPPPTQEMW